MRTYALQWHTKVSLSVRCQLVTSARLASAELLLANTFISYSVRVDAVSSSL